MFKRFTPKRLLIGAIAVCVLFVGGSFLYMQDARKEAERAKAEIQAREQARVEQQKQQAETAAAAAAQKADTAQQGGHFHADGTYHAGPHTEHAPTPTQQSQDATPVDFSPDPNVPYHPDFLAEYRAKYGEDPPPPGANWTHGLDTNGNPLRFYRGEATIVGIQTEIGFAPTKAQYERYQQLQADRRVAAFAGDQNRVDQISADIEQLVAASQGEVPTHFNTLFVGIPGEDRETHRKKVDTAIKQTRRKVMQQYGLAHLIED